MPSRVFIGFALAGLVGISLAACPTAAGADASASSSAPPPPPPVLDPVDTLRQLLAKNQAERERLLATKAEPKRQYLKQRLQELDLLDPAQRELRLRLLQLRYYLMPLLRTAPTNRQAMLASIPPTLRKAVDERLAEWDRLPQQRRSELLDNESKLQVFPRFELAAPGSTVASRPAYPAERRKQIEQELVRWSQYSPDQRQRMYQQFQHFLALGAEEREKALRTLPEAKQQQARSGLRLFENLPPEQRAKCLEAFSRFSRMNSEERSGFLENAARWETMTPEERRAWREIIAILPPSPPGLNASPGLPPMPPEPPRRPLLTNAAVTNTQASK